MSVPLIRLKNIDSSLGSALRTPVRTSPSSSTCGTILDSESVMIRQPGSLLI